MLLKPSLRALVRPVLEYLVSPAHQSPTLGLELGRTALTPVKQPVAGSGRRGVGELGQGEWLPASVSDSAHSCALKTSLDGPRTSDPRCKADRGS